MIKRYNKYLKNEHISYLEPDYDPNEIIELVGLPSGVYLETKRKNYTKIQQICNWSEKYNCYVYRDKDYNKILHLLDISDEPYSPSDEEYIAYKLQDLNIKNDYKIDKNNITIYGDVKISINNLKKLPIKIFATTGSFDISSCGLITLENCPTLVRKDFNCKDNLLISLEKGPNEVGGKYICSHNKLKTLRGGPSEVEFFDCSWNYLRGLEYSPSYVEEDFICNNNQINSLKSSPIIVKGVFDCRYNLLDNLKGLPRNTKEVLYDYNPMRDGSIGATGIKGN